MTYQSVCSLYPFCSEWHDQRQKTLVVAEESFRVARERKSLATLATLLSDSARLLAGRRTSRGGCVQATVDGRNPNFTLQRFSIWLPVRPVSRLSMHLDSERSFCALLILFASVYLATSSTTRALHQCTTIYLYIFLLFDVEYLSMSTKCTLSLRYQGKNRMTSREKMFKKNLYAQQITLQFVNKFIFK